MKTLAFHTLGCKLNFAESSQLIRELTAEGFSIVDFHEKADYYIIHSCIVTQKAEQKCIYSIRQAKKRNPQAQVAVIGCMPELNKNRLLSEDSNLLLLGNNQKYNLPALILNKNQGNQKEFNGFVPSYSSENRTRTFFKIQDGCNYYCTYCTIPFARGNSRSLNIEDTLKQISNATKNGCNELVLTGVNIGDFGRKHHQSLYDLLSQLHTLPDIKRIRLSSVEPDLLHSGIIRLVADSPLLMPHFHIPLQSATDKVLKLMNRKYNLGFFSDKVSEIKSYIPHACIATDIITGFPGESDADFEEGYQNLEKIPVSYMHVFTYSERPLTKASGMTEKVDPKSKRKRSLKLHELSYKQKMSFYKQNFGRNCEVLFESDNENGYLTGFTRNYVRVKTPFNQQLINTIRKVIILEAGENGICSAELI